MCHKVTERPGNKLTSFVYCVGIIENPFLHPWIIRLPSLYFTSFNLNSSFYSLPKKKHKNILLQPCALGHSSNSTTGETETERLPQLQSQHYLQSKLEATQSDIVGHSLTIIKTKIAYLKNL